jgi:four helix bundle protein
MTSYQELKGHRDLKVFQLAYRLAMEIFHECKSFPKDEGFSLADQIRRSSRSVAANIAEGFRKRQYPKMFVSKLADSDGEVAETQVWIDFARDCAYMDAKRCIELTQGYEEVGKMLGTMMSMPEKFLPRSQRRE